ncbi:carbonic anhydrase family protein [Nonomuraea sp. NPDC059007]|uniref:carbonic anhydrase family protein n=1 Tax=Nonomuraea sp. NPDC059007 TaxID=3346692 RepID=UPI0036B5A46F
MRIARLMAAITLVVPALLAPSAQARSPACPGTGTDAAVDSPVEIDAASACPAVHPRLTIAYAPVVDGIVTLQDREPLGGAPSEHDDIRFLPNGSASHVVFGGRTYTLLNVHYHGPAEHRFAGQGFAPLEAHLVHELAGPAQGYLVLSVLVNARRDGWSQHDVLLREPPSTVGATRRVHGVNPTALLPSPGRRAFYRYTGSLTTPEYDKPVTWIVFRQPGSATPHHVAGVRELWDEHGNRRPLQDNPIPPNIYRH